MTCDLWRNWCRGLARLLFHFSVNGKERKKKNVNRAQMLIRRRLTACHSLVQRATRVRVGVSEIGTCSRITILPTVIITLIDDWHIDQASLAWKATFRLLIDTIQRHGIV
jgi:hypothetical protein